MMVDKPIRRLIGPVDVDKMEDNLLNSNFKLGFRSNFKAEHYLGRHSGVNCSVGRSDENEF